MMHGPVVILNPHRISDQFLGQSNCYALTKLVVALAHATPLASLPFEAVNVYGGRDAQESEDRQEWRVSGVEKEARICLPQGWMDYRESGMREGFSDLAPDGRQMYQLHPTIL
jgi:hypothetical protein